MRINVFTRVLIVCMLLALPAHYATATRLLPSRVEFGDLRTFRDLAVALAGGTPVAPK